MSDRERGSEERWFRDLGMERDPFPEQDASTDFFARGGRERQLKALADLDHINRPLVGVVGDLGVGKTILFHALLRELPADARVARVTAGVFLSASALLLAVARAMGLEIEANENRESLRARLRTHIDGLSATGHHAVIMVDDAGDLETDALEEMAELARLGNEGLRVKVLLFARPGLRDALVRAVGAESLGVLFHEVIVERYSLNELRGYLQFRLARAGLKSNSPFTEEQYQTLFRRSGGIPGKANVLARQMLRERRRGLSRDQILWVSGGVAAALILGGLLILLAFGDDDAPAPTAAGTSVAPTGEGRAAPAEPSGAPDAPGDPAPRGTLTDEEIAIAGTWADQPPAATDVRAGTGSEPADAAGTQVPADDAGPAGTVAASTAADGGSGEADDRATDAAPGPAVASSAPEPTATEADRPSPRPGASLTSLDPSHFTLQVLVNSSSARARSWIADRADPERYRFYRRMRGDAPQYVVVYGDFPDRAAASIASDRLADAGEVSGAFMRTLASVQDEIRAAQ